MFTLLFSLRHKKVLPRIMLTSGIFLSGISASHAELFPEKRYSIPGSIATLYPADDNLLYVVYHKSQECPDSAAQCSSYAVIDNQSIKKSDQWVADDLRNGYRLNNLFRFTTIGPQNELYVASPTHIYKLSKDPENGIRSIFNTPEKIGNYTPKEINTFLFNKDFTQLYTGMTLGDSVYNAVAANALDSSSGAALPDYLWTDYRGFKIDSAIYSPYNQQLIYQSLSPNMGGYGLSTIDGSYQFGAGQWFSSGAVVIDEENMLYGLNEYQCAVNKIRLDGATSTLPGWTTTAEGCATSLLPRNPHITLGVQDNNLLYASYANAVYAMNRDTGATIFTVAAPEGTRFVHQTVFDPQTGWGYRSFTGENGSGVLAFSPDGHNSKIVLRRWNIQSAPVIQGNSLYIATNDVIYRYALDGQEIAGWEPIKQINKDVLQENNDDKFVVLIWSVKEHGIEIERNSVQLDPRDYLDGKISPYQWPLQLATAINERSLYLKAGEQQDESFTPLASGYRNFIFRPQGSAMSVDFEVAFYDLANCTNGCDNGVRQYWRINPTGSYICSFNDLAPHTEIKVTATPSFGPAETRFFQVRENGGRYSWPKFLSDFINQDFGHYDIRAGEKMNANYDVPMRTVYSGYRNRLWLANSHRIAIELPEGVGKVADDCDEHAMTK